MKKIIEKIIPDFLLSWYHFFIAFAAAVFYGFPARKMKVIGVTGTKGKTTVCNLIAQILEGAGYKVGLATTLNFKIAEREWKNETKQTMLGRFALQKLLKRMASAKCDYAVIETSSEGILQYRHRFIDYDIAVFTNLSPEHIERHKGFENYRSAKVKLFAKVTKKKDGVGIYNLDDKNVKYFLKPEIKNKYGYTLKYENPENFISENLTEAQPVLSPPKADAGRERFEEIKFSGFSRVSNINLFPNKTDFSINGQNFSMPLLGEFNVYNAAAAIATALSQNIPLEKIAAALKNAKSPDGRMEIIEAKNASGNFKIIIDYAHEPASLEALYQAVSATQIGQNGKMICLLGSQGGGRDKWKRPEMGKIAARYCDEIILTNEDPYDENPEKIIEDIENGILESAAEKSFSSNRSRPAPLTGLKTGCASVKFSEKDFSAALYKITDRKTAIKKAISIARLGDAVVLSGKGGEMWMCVENGKKIPWDEKEIVKEELKK